MNARRFSSFAATLPERPGIDAEISFLLSCLDAPPQRSANPLPIAAAVAVLVGSAGQAFAHVSQHVVVSGESLYRIAERQLGDATRWPEIAKLNHLVDPARIQIGQILMLPGPRVAHNLGRRSARSQLGQAHKITARIASKHVEIVPAGTVVAELPAPGAHRAPRAEEIVPRGSVVLALAAPGHGTKPAARWSVLPAWHPALPSESTGWLALDSVAFLAGMGFGLRLLARKRARPVAPQLAQVLATSEFWNRLPASQDLRALQTS